MLSVKFLNFWTKITKWEYWPFEVAYFPIFLYWLWLSLKARSFFFFSAANPAIETGGMLGESKFDILNKIKTCYKPATILIEMPKDFVSVLKMIDQYEIGFPLIAKPDIGERGWKVEKISNQEELASYMKQMKGNFIIQEYIDFEIELGIFYYRFPRQQQGLISSIVMKEFLTLTGDGKCTVAELIMRNERARMQLPVLKEKYRLRMQDILLKGEKIMLEPIGNHCRGTKFLNANHLINDQLIEVFDLISHSIPGFYYGRYDIRCSSVEALYEGRDIKILELNGSGAEPGHIYDPKFPLIGAYRVLFHHWSILYQISKANYRTGVKYMTLKESSATIKKLRKYRKLANEI